MEKAGEIAAWFQKLFGDDYYIEIQNNGLEIQRVAMEAAVEVAKRLGIPLVATSDVHYVHREDAEAQDILLCVNTGKFRTDTNRMRMDTQRVLSAQSRGDVRRVSRHGRRRAPQSQEIADCVDIELELGKRHFPVFTPPDEQDVGRLSPRAVPDGLEGALRRPARPLCQTASFPKR